MRLCVRVLTVRNDFMSFVTSSLLSDTDRLIIYGRHTIPQDELADKFVQGVEESGQQLSMAHLQGYFMFHKEDPHAAITNTPRLFEQ